MPTQGVLDESIAYGNLPNWVANGLPNNDVWLPQTTLVNAVPVKYATPMFPPIYAGRATKDTTPRQLEPRMKAHSLKTRSLDTTLPWDNEPKMEPRQWSAYKLPVKRNLVRLPPMIIEEKTGEKEQVASNKNIDDVYSSRAKSVNWRNNTYNVHAKQGFKFWLEEPKAFSRSSKYTFGSYRTFLGLGNAPRN
ncbi:uncharacterized protein [Ptychodera flava]|uniref:uncharacterized protein isoform X2 n=1 Tax=Ptychodera flava TaxID=63121 RepID=UPI00396A1626